MGAFVSRLLPGGFGGGDHGIAGRARKYRVTLDPRMDSTSPTGEPSVHDAAMKDSALNATVYPPASFVNNAHVSSLKQYNDMYRESVDRPAKFWGKIADELYWHTPYDKSKPVHSFNFDVRKGPISISWFPGGKTNLCYNAVDRHAASDPKGTALLWEGNETNQDEVVTWAQLKERVCQLANYLRSVGVGKGDNVTIYLPMVPHLVISMLACARIGAVHSVVFAGFSADALASRLVDSKPKVVLTSTGTMRGAKPIPIKKVVDAGIKLSKDKGVHVERVVVYDHPALPLAQCNWDESIDANWSDVVDTQPKDSPVEWMDSEDPLFRLYTSGSTGTPKGVLHTTGGYMVGTYATFKYVFDHKPDDVFWCTADAGWITGHSYLAYGPLIAKAKCVVFEGVPTYPDAGRCWDIVDKYGVTVLYTAPTLIRSLIRFGDDVVNSRDLSTLRLLGSVGEPINPEAWKWYHEVVGKKKCPIVDTWWQTETGAHMITPLPGAFAQKPGSASRPFFGVVPTLVDSQTGKELPPGPGEGVLCIKGAWPSMMRTVAGNHQRFEETYFSTYPGFYFTGDGARRDEDGYFWITGRVDDVINVSGHRIGTAEVESALVEHDKCAEAAVVGYEHDIKGQAIYAFVVMKEGVEFTAEMKKELVMTVRSIVGAFAAPDTIHWCPTGLPKTRSGKIMRRILRKIAAHEEDGIGDTSTLADPAVVNTILEWRGK